jgi:uncharacterized membrane protein YoaK (UPF0700 family)
LVLLGHSNEIKTAVISNKAKDFLFVMLSCAAGSMDALSVASALSGNTVVLGASLVQGESTKALLGIFVFVGYIPGAALAAFLLRQEKQERPKWTRWVTQILGIEVISLLILALGTYVNHNYSSFNIGLVTLVFLLPSQWESNMPVLNKSIE